MKILGIDTSNRFCNLAVIEDREILIEYSINGAFKKHSSILIPAIQEMFANINLKLNNIDGIAVTIGPGSFTGLRIGLSTAKGLSYAASVPLTGIFTLDAMVYHLAKIPNILCPVLDARKGEVYFAMYHGGEDLNKIIDYQCSSIDTLLEKVIGLTNKIFFLGEGTFKYKNKIKSNLGSRAIFMHPIISNLKASDVAFLGLKKIEKGEIDDVASITPFYIRKSEAEIAWEKNNT